MANETIAKILACGLVLTGTGMMGYGIGGMRAYREGYSDGVKHGIIKGSADVVSSIKEKWEDLKRADIADSSWWLNAVCDACVEAADTCESIVKGFEGVNET